jgi:predicted DNA-binding protein with PD1-like motif
MKYTKVTDGYVLRLDKGEKLKESLMSFIAEQQINAAWFSGLGGFQSVELGFYDLPEKTYRWRTIDELVELTGLQGNIAQLDGQPALHLHGTVATRTYEALAGHINEAVIAGSCELHITVFAAGSLTRAQDENTGLNSLAL